jgi:hypothetical protein
MANRLRERKEQEEKARLAALAALQRQRAFERSFDQRLHSVLVHPRDPNWAAQPAPFPALARAGQNCREVNTRHALMTLVLHVAAQAPELLRAAGSPGQPDYAAALGTLAGLHREWLRSVDGWKPTSHNPGRQFGQLARYLLARYPVPRFMDSLLLTVHARVEERWFCHVGGGANLRTAPGLTVPLTKRMAHHVLRAPDDFDMVRALRWGEVLGLDGSPRLAEALVRTPLGRRLWSAADEEWWQTVVHWFVNQAMLDRAQVGPIVDYLIYRRFGSDEEDGDRDFSMKGRTATALLRLVEEWHRQLNQARQAAQRARRGRGTRVEWEPGRDFPRSGFRSGNWTFGKDERRVMWRLRELTTLDALFEEGRELRHCVASYAWSIERGDCSIWSLQVQRGQLARGERAVTLEVHHRSGAVVQARGFGNRLPNGEELRIIGEWAADNGLQLRV